MDFFLFTPASISYLTQFLLAISISVFLAIRLWGYRQAQLAFLTGFFVLVT